MKGSRHLRRHAKLRLLARGVHFHQQVYDPPGPPRPPIDLLHHFFPVHRVNEVNPLDDIFDLVGLQVTDEVPPNGFVGKPVPLPEEFLHVVLADVSNAGIDDLCDSLGRKCLRDRDQRYIRGIAACPHTCLADPPVDLSNRLLQKRGIQS